MRAGSIGPAMVAVALLGVTSTALAALDGLRVTARPDHGPTREFTALATPRFAPVAATPTLPAPVGPGSVRTLELPARDAPGGRRQVWVYHPAVPDTAQLPVLYFLHGLPGSAEDLAEQADLATSLDRAFLAGTLEPFVVAAPDGNSLGARDPEWADSVKGYVKLESFVTGPLIDAVEGTHRRDVHHRAIAGFSMGGYGAMNLAARHPDLYGQVASLAGYFHVDDPSHVFGRRPALEAANSPDRYAAALGDLRVFLADGAQDDEPVARGETLRFAQLLAGAGTPVDVRLPTGGHSWAFVRAVLPRVEAFLEQGWAPRPPWDHPGH